MATRLNAPQALRAPTVPPTVQVRGLRRAFGDTVVLDDLDLDTASDEAVTVVEWGEGMAEQLNDSWLSVSIEVRGARPIDPLGTEHDGDHPDEAEPRVVTIKPNGPRWVDVPLRSTLLG